MVKRLISAKKNMYTYSRYGKCQQAFIKVIKKSYYKLVLGSAHCSDASDNDCSSWGREPK